MSQLERLRALCDSGSLSAAEFELKQQVLREPGLFAAQALVLLAPTASPPPRRLSPPPRLPTCARDGDAAARGAATADVRPAAAVRRGAGAAARVRRSRACASRLRRRRRHRGRRFLVYAPPARAAPRPPRRAHGAPPPDPGTYRAARGRRTTPARRRRLLSTCSRSGCYFPVPLVSAPAGYRRDGLAALVTGWRAFLASMCVVASIHIAAAIAPANRRAPLASFAESSQVPL